MPSSSSYNDDHDEDESKTDISYDIVHFQSLYDNKYQQLRIKHVVLMIDYWKASVLLFDIDNSRYYDFNSGNRTESSYFRTLDLDDIIKPGDEIIDVVQDGDNYANIFVKKRLCL